MEMMMTTRGQSVRAIVLALCALLGSVGTAMAQDGPVSRAEFTRLVNELFDIKGQTLGQQGRIEELEKTIESLTSELARLKSDGRSGGAGPSSASGARPPLEKRIEDLEKRLVGSLGDNGPVRFKAPFEVTDNAGNALLRVESDGGRGKLIVGSPANGVTLGLSDKGSGFISVTAAERRTGLVIGSAGNTPFGLHVLGTDGTRDQISLALDAAGRGRLQVGDISAGSVEVGVGNSGAGFLSVDREDGGIGGFIGRYKNDRFAVSIMGAGDVPAASLFGDTLGGNIRVMNAKGVPVGGLFSEEEGGGLVLTGPAGGDSVVDLGVRAGGGSMQVYSIGGGSPRAGIVAEESVGKVLAFNSDGQPVAALFSGLSGQGRLQLSNRATVVVEAGMTSEGLGVVRTGPVFGAGPAGALAIPWQIVGHK